MPAQLFIVPASIACEEFFRKWVPLMSLSDVDIRLEYVPEEERSEDYNRILDIRWPNGEPVFQVA